MRPLLFSLFAFCFIQPVTAQNIPIDFTNNPDKPIVIENRATGKTLFFFYPEKLKSTRFAKEGNPCKAYEINTATLQVLRVSPELALHISSEDLKVRHLCRFSRGDDYYFVLENNDSVQVMRIEGQGLTIQKTDTYAAEKGGRIIGGVADGPNAYVLSSQKKKKGDDLLFVHQIDENGKLQKHTFPVGETMIDEIPRGEYSPLSVEYGAEEEPEAASKKVKLYAGEQRLWLTMDNAWTGGTNQAQAALLKVITFDLATDSMRVQQFGYTDKRVYNAENEARNSFIFDKKVFQLYMNHEQFMLRVRDLDSGEPLFSKILMREDTIEGIANSPILVPGRGSFGIEKEYRSVRKFVRRFSKFRPFMQVRREGDDYLMCIGGYEEITTFSPGMNPGTGTFAAGPGYMNSYERAFSFYSAINAQTMTRSSVFFKKSLIEAYNDMLTVVERPRDQALYHIGNHFYLGYFNKPEKKYRLRQLKLQTR